MKLDEVTIGQTVEVMLGGSWREGIVEAVHAPRPVYPDGYVQVDVDGFTWLGAPEKVRTR